MKDTMKHGKINDPLQSMRRRDIKADLIEPLP